MKRKHMMIPVLAVAFVLAGGCGTSLPVSTFKELAGLNGQGPLRILTSDTVLYSIARFTFDRDGITGEGSAEKGDSLSVFSGTIPFSRILFIERQSSSFWKGSFMVPLTIGLALGFQSTFAESPRFSITRPSGSSCPFVYAYDGARYRLEAEVFGTSLSRSFERETLSLLPSLKAGTAR